MIDRHRKPHTLEQTLPAGSAINPVVRLLRCPVKLCLASLSTSTCLECVFTQEKKALSRVASGYLLLKKAAFPCCVLPPCLLPPAGSSP